MALPVTLVVDTGVDDALALLVAARHPGLDLSAVVATGGNVPLARVVANTAYVLRLLGADVPLARGAASRADGTPYPPRIVHGPDGLAGLGPPSDYPDPPELPVASDVVAPDRLLVCLGPLTSVAALVQAGWSSRVVAACARSGEANAAMDPIAARLVAASGLDLVHYGGRAFAAPRVTSAEAARLVTSADPVAALAGRLLVHQAARGAGIGDAGTVLWVAEPGVTPREQTARLLQLAGT